MGTETNIEFTDCGDAYALAIWCIPYGAIVIVVLRTPLVVLEQRFEWR